MIAKGSRQAIGYWAGCVLTFAGQDGNSILLIPDEQ